VSCAGLKGRIGGGDAEETDRDWTAEMRIFGV
jgi:hypothetical protein